MDLEPTLAVAEAPMTIDYDQPQGEVIPDAEMGLAAPVVTSAEPSHPELAFHAEEAEMQDDRAIDNVVEEVTARESEVIMVEEDDAVDVPFSNVEEEPVAAIIDAQDVEPVIAPSVTANELADSGPDTATLAPAPISSSSSREEAVAKVGLTTTETTADGEATPTVGDDDETVIETIETTTVEALVTSVEDGVASAAAAAGDLEQPEASVVDDASATGQTPIDDKDAIEDAPTVEQSAEGAETTKDVKVGQTAESVPPLFAIATEKLSEQIPKFQAAPDAPTGDAQNARPPVDKDPLLQVQLPAELFPAPEASTSTARLAPGVLLTCGGTTYSLFRHLQVANEPSFHHEDEDEDDDQEGKEPQSGEVDAPLILPAMAQHALYYEPVDRLVQALRELLPELNGEADELVLDFEDLGITVGEDNVYSRQVTLFDFDRLQLGCQIPNRLQARIYAQPRFASGFNALAQHIASTYSSTSLLEGEEEEDAHQAGSVREGEGEYVEEEPEAEDEGGEEEEEEEGTGAADDYDGPDSELPVMSASGEEGEGDEVAEGEGDDDDEFDLESALAQLDQDNIVAVVEGAQEDLLLEPNERAVVDEEEGEDQHEEAAAAAAAEGQEDGAAGGGEEPQGEGEDDQSWQVVETAEAVESTATTTTTMTQPETSGPVVGETLAKDEGAEAELDDGAKGVGQSVNITPDQAVASQMSEHEEVSQEAMVDESESARPAESAQAADTVTVEANGAAVVDDIVPVTGEQAEVPEGETAPDPSDVVIDYDEAFDPSSTTSADVATEEQVTVANGVTETEGPPPSPKRSRSFDAVEGREAADEDLAADAKRPRLGESETDGPAEAATA